MRQIKFRFFDRALSKIIHRHLQPHDCEHKDIEVMQFTGLTDVNNVEIYEGDILKCHQFLFDGNEVEKEWIASVFYSADDNFTGGGIAGFCLKIISGDFYFEHTSEEKGSEDACLPMSHIYGLHEDSFEVVGNIYQNPEFLNPSIERLQSV